MHRVAVLALDGVYPFELGIPHRIFSAANSFLADDHRYEIVTGAVDDRPVRTNADFHIVVEHGPDLLRTADTVVIPPCTPVPTDDRLPEPVVAALAQITPGTRVVSVCTGAYVLAAAGRLDGRPATTHWARTEEFRKLFPRVRLDPNVLFVDDGDVLTSAGAASGVDICVHIVRTDHGSVLANRVARMCVVPPWRDGGQAQYIEQPVPEPGANSIAATRQWALENLHLPLSLADLADHARMPLRTFNRRFRDQVGVSPGRWLIQQRLHRARQLLETSDLPVDRIAGQVGFATGGSLRQHLRATIGVSPSRYRQTFQAARVTSPPRAGL